VACLIVCAPWATARAEDPAFLANFGQFDFGRDQSVPFEVSAWIRDHKADAAKLAVLNETLKRLAATDDGLNLTCVTLGECGGNADVPYLAAQLAKPKIFHSALIALQRINSPEAAKTLLDFAGKLKSGDDLAVVALSLGRMRSAEAVPMLIKATTDASPVVQIAAFEALARIATPEAVAAIKKAAPQAEDGSASAMMMLAQTFAAQGQKAEAAALAKKVMDAPGLPAGTRGAAIGLILSADLPGAGELLAKLAADPQPATLPFVLANFARLDASRQAQIVAEITKAADPKAALGQLRLIGKNFPLPAFIQLLGSSDESLRVVATLLLASKAQKADFDQLLAVWLAAPSGDAGAEAFRVALVSLPVTADEWLAEAIPQTQDPAKQVALIALAKDRTARAASGALLAAAASSDAAVRKAAFEALAVTGAPDQAEKLLDMLLAAKEPAERRDLAKALSVSLRTSPDKSAVISKATAQLATVSDPALKDTIIDLMGKSGEPACLPVLFAEFQKSDKARRTAILRAISNWQDEGPLDDLAIIAAGDPDPASRIFALRAFLDVLNRSQTVLPEARLQRLWQANLLATRPEEHRMIISQAATNPLPATRMLLGSYRFDPEVKAELAAANKAHDALLTGPRKPKDPDDTNPAADEENGNSAKDKPADESKAKEKPKFPVNPFDNPAAFEKWEDPLGFAGRWTSGAVTLDLVQYPNRTFQALLTTEAGAAPRKVLGLLAADGTLRLHGVGVTGSMTKEGVDLTLDGKPTKLQRTPVGKTDAFPRPPTAKVIFDGKDLTGLRATKATILPDGSVQMSAASASLTSKENFGAIRAYAEFRIPFNPESTGPRRGNSGFYMQKTYEVQIQDGFGAELSPRGAEPADRFCGSIYGIAAPKLNACAPPLEWQSLLVEFRPPEFDNDGKKIRNANISAWLNGVQVQDKVDVPRPTGGDRGPDAAPAPEPTAPGPILLQYHGNDLQFRNIWVEPLP
jgi:hypothetical protein